MKKIRITIISLTIIILVIVLSFIAENWIPGKYAIKESDFKSYEPYILVQEVHYTGTGWVQVGNENGYFLPEEWIGCGMLRPVYFLEDNKAVVLNFESNATWENLRQIELFNRTSKQHP